MSTTPAEAYGGQFGVGSALPVTHRIDIIRENVILQETTIDTNGIRGTRSRSSERVRQGPRSVNGQIVMQPNSLDLTFLLDWVMGGSPSGSGTVTYPLGETLQDRYLVFDRVAKVFTYNGCRVNRWTVAASQGEPLNMTFDVCGIDETVGNAGTFPSLSLDVTTQPFVFTDLAGAFTLGGVPYDIKDIEITLDNAIDTNRYFQNLTRTALYAQDRHVHIRFTNPYGDATALYGSGLLETAVVATFTNGSAVLAFTFPKFIVPRRSPDLEGRGSEVMIPFDGVCYRSGSTPEMSVSLAPGP